MHDQMFNLLNRTKMKKFLALIICAMLGLTASYAKIAHNNADKTANKIEWKTKSIDLGSVKKGIPVEVSFDFTNTGNEPLLLTEVKTSCGCTLVNYPKEPIQPGKTGKINATYDARSAGHFSKSITVKSNFATEDIVLNLSGTVGE